MNYIAIKLTYKASGLHGINKKDLEELHTDLRENYISHIRSNSGPQAGGLVDAIVEIMLDTTFVEFFKILRDGFIFDTITRGNKSFILKPIFDAFKRMEAKNEYWDYCQVSFLFNSTEIVVHGMEKMFTSRLGVVFDALIKHYKNLGEPYEIVIPLTKEVSSAGQINYKSYQGDNFELKDYVKYWGISYNSGFDRMIYDLDKSELQEGTWDF